MILGAMLIIGAVCSCGSVSGAEAEKAAQAYSQDKILIVFEEDVTKKEAEAALSEERVSESAPEYIYGRIASLALCKNVSPKEAVKKLNNLDEIKFAQPDYIYQYDGYTNDPEISAPRYNINRYKYHYIFEMGLAGPGITAWNYAKGKGINVAVIDGGANVNHRELRQNVKGAYNSATQEEGLEYVKDTSGHGSATAGILAAVGNNSRSAAGVACSANLYIIKAENNGEILTSSIIEGLRWAIEKKCRVININLGSDYASKYPADRAAEELIIRQAYNSGDALTVCAGGNNGTGAYHYPASWDEALSVSALTYDPSCGYRISSRSNHNDQIDIAAPGSRMYSISHTSNTRVTGPVAAGEGATSYAAAYAAGVAALVFSANPDLTAEQCAKILMETAKDAGVPGRDVQYGCGVIDPLAAVQRAKLNRKYVYRGLKIPVRSYRKSASGKAFRLGVSLEGSGVVSYRSSRLSVAKVDSKGKVTLKGPGKTIITASVPRSGIYSAASERITLTVVPGKMGLSSVKAGKGFLKVSWKRDKKVTGYQLAVARDKKFTKGKKQIFIKGNRKTNKKITGLLRKKVYYVKVRSYKISGGKKLYGAYGKSKRVKVK